MTEHQSPVEHKENLLANLALLWLGVGLILMPILRMLLWQLDSSFGAKSLIGLLEVGFILLVLVNRQVTFYLPTLPRLATLATVFWLSWAVLSIVLMEHRTAGLLRQAEWLGHVLFLVTAISFFRRYPVWLNGVIRFVLFSYLLICMLIITIWSNQLQPKDFAWRGGFAGFTHIRLFGHFTLLVLALSSAALWSKTTPKLTGSFLFMFVCACLAWAGLFWAGGRAPLLAALLAIPVVILLRREGPGLKVVVAWFAFSALLGAIISLPFSLPDQGMGLTRMFMSADGIEGIDKYSSGRFTAWSQFARHLATVPLFGEGPDGYLFYAANSVWPHTVQPHNLVFQALFDWGVPGALAFFLLLAVLVIHAIRNSVNCSDEFAGTRVASLLGVLALLVLSILTGPLYHAWTLMLFALSLALALMPHRDDPLALKPLRRHGKSVFLVATAALLAVFTANAITLFVVLSPTAPVTPDAPSVRLMKLFPAPLAHPWTAPMLDQWPDQWQLTAEKKCEWLHWVGQETRAIDAGYSQTRHEMLADSGCL